MPEVPKKITFDLPARRVLIDGVELPWIIAGDGPSVVWLDLRGHALVTFTIPADAVDVIPASPESAYLLPAPAESRQEILG